MGIILQLIYYVLLIFELILFARVILSWFPNVDRQNPLIQLVYNVTEPVLKPIRELLPQNMMFDFSPLIVFLIITLVMRLLF